VCIGLAASMGAFLLASGEQVLATCFSQSCFGAVCV
jgi:ATP-dependent protease ClpP protease subunit